MISHRFGLDTPFTSTVHPQAETLRSYGRAWVQKVGLVQTPGELERFDAACYWQLIAQAYPTAPWEVLAIALTWNVWGFFLDDVDDASQTASQLGSLQTMFAHILAILQDETIAQNHPAGLMQGLADVWQRIQQRSSGEWRRRFVGALMESFLAYQWEAQNRVQRRVPPVTEYVLYRRKTGGWMTDLLLVDLALGNTIPAHLFHHPALRQLLDTANNIICWANDLFSFEKEQRIGEIHNLVHVVQAEYRCSTEAAIQIVVRWHNQEVQRWQHLKQQHIYGAESAEARYVQAYVQFCEDFIAANFAWSQVTGRYRSSPQESASPACLASSAHVNEPDAENLFTPLADAVSRR